MTTTLDTSGGVGIVTAAPQGGSYCQTVRWPALSPFTQGYIEALFAGCVRADATKPAGQMARPYAFYDLAPETLARIIADCEAADMRAPGGFGEGARGGAAFWRMRQNNQIARFPPLTVQLGDDGKVRFSERG